MSSIDPLQSEEHKQAGKIFLYVKTIALLVKGFARKRQVFFFPDWSIKKCCLIIARKAERWKGQKEKERRTRMAARKRVINSTLQMLRKWISHDALEKSRLDHHKTFSCRSLVLMQRKVNWRKSRKNKRERNNWRGMRKKNVR